MSTKSHRERDQLDATDSTQQSFDFDEELARLEEVKKIARPRTRRSKLDPHRKAILELRSRGASLKKIVVWLRQRAGLSAKPSTLSRYLKRLLGGME